MDNQPDKGIYQAFQNAYFPLYFDIQGDISLIFLCLKKVRLVADPQLWSGERLQASVYRGDFDVLRLKDPHLGSESDSPFKLMVKMADSQVDSWVQRSIISRRSRLQAAFAVSLPGAKAVPASRCNSPGIPKESSYISSKLHQRVIKFQTFLFSSWNLGLCLAAREGKWQKMQTSEEKQETCYWYTLPSMRYPSKVNKHI